MKFLIFFSINIFCFYLYCFDLYSEDTTRTIVLPEIKVIEQKSKSNTALDFSPTITIDKEQIQIVGAKQLSELLILSPSVNIQNQGGLGGMKTLSMRGMSSSRNLILLDGMPLNSAQNGSFDLSNIDVSSIDNIEIIRGGASSLFGGSAIGGAVNIRTQTQMKEYVKANISYGSFNEKGFGATLNLPYSIPTSIINTYGFFSFGFNSLNSDGNYPFIFSQFGEEKKYYRENADYNNLRLLFTTGAEHQSNKSDGKVDWKMRITYSGTDKGIPAPILQGQVNNSNERLEETDINIYFNANILLSKLEINSAVLGKYNGLFIGTDDKNNQIRFSLFEDMVYQRWKFNLWNIKNEFFGSYSSSSLSGDMLDLKKNEKIYREIFAVAHRLEKDFFIDRNLLRFNLTGRYDIGFGEEQSIKNKSTLTGNFGIIFRPKDIPLTFRTNISHNFRFPNFNEMYYRNYGTKDLLPEKSNNINIGAEYNLFNKINLSLDAFYLDISNMIVAIPTSPISWSARNIARAECIGTEVAITLFNDIKISNNFSINSISMSYTLQQNLDKSPNTNTYNKQLTYIPNELTSALIGFKLFDYVVGSKLEYSSHRYYLADNSINSLLPSYIIADVFVKLTPATAGRG